jgi:hypothetical protein
MSKIYTIAFRMGVLFNVLLWTILNILSFLDSREGFLYWQNASFWASHLGEFNWGIPFQMFQAYELYNAKYLVLNTIVYVVCGFFFGFLFKFVRSKISRRKAVLK